MKSITYEPHKRKMNKTLERTSVNTMKKIKTYAKENSVINPRYLSPSLRKYKFAANFIICILFSHKHIPSSSSSSSLGYFEISSVV